VNALSKPLSSLPLAKCLLGFRKHLPSWVEAYIGRIERVPGGRRLAHGAFWILSSTVLMRLLGFVSTVVITRVLGRERYGQVGIIQNTVDMFSVIAALGLSFTATKYVAEFRRTQPERAGRIIALTSGTSWITGGIVALAVIIAAPWLAATTLHEPSLTRMLQAGALLLFFGAWNSAQVGSLSGLEAFRARATVSVKAYLINFPLMILGVYFAGPMGVIVGLVTGEMILSALYSLTLRREARAAGVPLVWKGASKEFGLIVSFGLPAMLSTLIIAPVNWTCNTMLINHPGGYGELGIYNAAIQWNGAIMFIPTMLSAVSIPVLSDLIGHRQWSKVSQLVKTSVKLQFLIIVPVGVLSGLSPWAMRLYGQGFASGSSVMLITVWVALFSALYSPLWPLVYAAGKAKSMLTMNACCGGLFLLFSHLFIPGYGAKGLALAKLASTAVNCGWLFIISYRTIQQGIRTGPPPTDESSGNGGLNQNRVQAVIIAPAT
jgi:O-antigen/teichoic acid export membrane protein